MCGSSTKQRLRATQWWEWHKRIEDSFSLSLDFSRQRADAPLRVDGIQLAGPEKGKCAALSCWVLWLALIKRNKSRNLRQSLRLNHECRCALRVNPSTGQTYKFLILFIFVISLAWRILRASAPLFFFFGADPPAMNVNLVVAPKIREKCTIPCFLFLSGPPHWPVFFFYSFYLMASVGERNREKEMREAPGNGQHAESSILFLFLGPSVS